MTPPVFSLLSNNAGAALVLGAGDACRVYPHGAAPADVPRPYVTWFIVDGDPENVMEGTPGSDSFVVQFDAWGDEAAHAKAAAVAVRDAVETIGYVVRYNPNGKDPSTGRFGFSFDAEFRVLR